MGIRRLAPGLKGCAYSKKNSLLIIWLFGLGIRSLVKCWYPLRKFTAEILALLKILCYIRRGYKTLIFCIDRVI